MPRFFIVLDLPIKASPVNVQLQLARSYAGFGRFDDAIVNFERAFRRGPRNVLAALELISLYQTTERLLSARRIVDEALKRNPGHPLLLKRKGDVAFREGTYPLVVTSYEEAHAAGDSSAALLKMLGIAAHLSGDHDRAEVWLERARHMDENDPSIFFYLGVVKRELRKLDEAQSALDRATLLATGLLPDIYAQRAVTSEEAQDIKSAVKYYRLAMTLNPAKTDLLFHLATVYDRHYADDSVAAAYYEQ